jgi:hypothetical protein
MIGNAVFCDRSEETHFCRRDWFNFFFFLKRPLSNACKSVGMAITAYNFSEVFFPHFCVRCASSVTELVKRVQLMTRTGLQALNDKACGMRIRVEGLIFLVQQMGLPTKSHCCCYRISCDWFSSRVVG